MKKNVKDAPKISKINWLEQQKFYQWTDKETQANIKEHNDYLKWKLDAPKRKNKAKGRKKHTCQQCQNREFTELGWKAHTRAFLKKYRRNYYSNYGKKNNLV